MISASSKSTRWTFNFRAKPKKSIFQLLEKHSRIEKSPKTQKKMVICTKKNLNKKTLSTIYVYNKAIMFNTFRSNQSHLFTTLSKIISFLEICKLKKFRFSSVFYSFWRGNTIKTTASSILSSKLNQIIRLKINKLKSVKVWKK